MVKTEQCWCGSSDLAPYSDEYVRCQACDSLLIIEHPSAEALLTGDDEGRYYGKEYWLNAEDEKNPGLIQGPAELPRRARSDFTERGIYWLRSVLRHLLPPVKTIEVGCAPGVLVALMKQAGFIASGTEMSPWAVAEVNEMFGVPVVCSRMEELPGAAGQFDAVLSFDVIEHLLEPRKALQRCAEVLKPEGILVIQTPLFRRLDIPHSQLVAEDDIFVKAFLKQHLILYSDSGLRKLLAEFGFRHVVEEPAMMGHDCFLFASREPVPTYTPEEITKALTTPSGRLVQAFIDQDNELTESNRERDARLGVIKELEREVANLARSLQERLQTAEAMAAEQTLLRSDLGQRAETIELLNLDAKVLLASIEDHKVAVAAMQKTADERLASVEEHRAQLAEIKRTADERLALVEEHRDQLAAMQQTAENRLAIIEEQAAALDVLRNAADERLALIERQSAELQSLRSAPTTQNAMPE
jgi:2-polyprenyl-3-methyl-5-hydroxy-6-metoxy-1,4-benzoquinol methylase